MPLDSTDSWNHFLYPCCGSIFPAKSCQDTWKSGSQLARGQVNMADEAELGSPNRSTFEALVVRCMVGHCRREELGLFCWPMLAAGIAFLVHLMNLLSIILRCNGFTRIQKAVVGQPGSRLLNKDHDLFGECKFGFGKCFAASSLSNPWGGIR